MTHTHTFRKTADGGMSRPPSGRGFALVIVLMILVLMLGVVLAFFSKATLNRMISGSSAANQQVKILTDSAVEVVVADLVHEIRAGSEADSFAVPIGGTHVFPPRLVDTTLKQLGVVMLFGMSGETISISAAPSLVPQRVVTDAAAAPGTLLKQSVRNQPFFVEVPNVIINAAPLPFISNRAAAVNTADPAKNKIRINPERWTQPGFAGTGQTIAPPDWIYLNRAGETPTAFSQDWRERSPSANLQFIIGRFAYNVYDVGGLIDINVVGNSLTADENARRGRLSQVSLTTAPGALAVPGFSDFLAWRSPGDNSNSTAPGGLFDPARTNLDVAAGSQALVTRQELLKYAEAKGTIPAAALPFLTTFSRDINAPAHEPEPNRPLEPVGAPGDSTPEQLNPGLAAVRFAAETELARGTDADVTVPTGTPVMARRFPLSKLDLLADPSAAAADLAYYFGLERQADGSFRYTAGASDGRMIKRLDDVATESREPNFFEVLQATIVTGSLGRNSGNTYTIEQPRDVLRNLQVLQIGANIIDQWDADDFPVNISYPSGNPGEWLSFYGIENLPYINNFQFVGWRPEWDRNRFQVWMVFDVWNPHQNATTVPGGIEEFRIVPVSGRLRPLWTYRITTDNTIPGFSRNHPVPGTTAPQVWQDVFGLNVNRNFNFPNVIYANPTEIRGETPTGADYTGGLLLIDYPNVPAAVPANPNDMNPDLKAHINKILVSYGREKLPPDGTGFFGAKPHNYMRILGEPGNLANFALQYRRAGSSEWKTYQTINDVVPGNSGPIPLQGQSTGSSTLTHGDINGEEEVDRVAYHGATASPPEDYGFYGWRNTAYGGSFLAVLKADPRTIRFGHLSHWTSTMGTTIRQSANAPVWSNNANAITEQNNWRAIRGGLVAGLNAKYSPRTVEAFQWAPKLVASSSIEHRIPFGWIANIPEGGLDNITNPSRYVDRDGMIRPGDGYLGAVPTANPPTASGRGSREDRPIILNRAFRSVGEMGYAFRDLPWKTLDFFNRNSGDLGLLDAFSLDETPGAVPLVAGRVNLNSAPVEVFETLLQGAGKTLTAARVISATEAKAIADAIILERQTNGPFRDAGDMVSRVLSPTSATSPGVVTDLPKHQREAAIRVLSGLGTTRTWNLLIDLVVQSGGMAPAATGPADFIVRAERRVWIHLALDRLTGKVIDQNWELVDE